jgi:hypothetical protein
LFIVPMIATSPSSTRRLVMMPSIGRHRLSWRYCQRALQRSLRLEDARADAADLRYRDVELDLGHLQLVLGDELLVKEFLLPVVVAPVARQPGLDLDEFGPGPLDESPVAIRVGLVLSGVEFEEEVAGLDFLALDHTDLDDPARHLGADFDVFLGFDLAGSGNEGGQVRADFPR